jgi:undecaprenyl-phosphate 4-deoxy-4-formamido-L-arabinose transferase
MGRSISVVIPVYRGEQTIGPLVDKLFAELGDGLRQVVLVNDDSPDASDRVCRSIVDRYPRRVTYLRLGRNFGEHNAVMAGLRHAVGEHIVVMDDDFQNPPEEVAKLVDHAVAHDCDVVYACYDDKRHSLFRNLGSRFAGYAATVVIGKPADLYLSSFKCINAWLRDQIVRYEGPFPYVDGFILCSTSRIGRVQVRHDDRSVGRSGYTLGKLASLWLRIFVNFSVLPLRISTIAGAGLSLFGVAFGFVVIWEKLTSPELPVGWASLFSSILVFSGVQLLMVGLLGEYLGRLYLTVNRIPQFTVREVLP